MKINSEDCYGVKKINMTIKYLEKVKNFNSKQLGTEMSNEIYDKEGCLPYYMGVPINIDDDLRTDYELVR